ncbi:uncharacterized protein BCR38DRAFT_411512 [Pseudomassariella vexata]|uniref:Cytochrome oxidase c assembly-domain-containing protein n=1 Tax=Pseudomassariella vexata TaxID=1141098 RepID=A0A1Y2DQV0_9PEZI|nr:uncharacterized protein BCR38DRAFT_411512 [Pseudomassariella vexata]ORY61658.1 hypothetical protein BCR38DRAFT_411512 [Pseudomassariella vexata]
MHQQIQLDLLAAANIDQARLSPAISEYQEIEKENRPWARSCSSPQSLRLKRFNLDPAGYKRVSLRQRHGNNEENPIGRSTVTRCCNLEYFHTVSENGEQRRHGLIREAAPLRRTFANPIRLLLLYAIAPNFPRPPVPTRAMAVDGTPRSVADATRFTSNTLHAASKAGSFSPGGPASRTTKPKSSPSVKASATTASRPLPLRRPPPAGMGSKAVPETLEERVRRLRAAHLAARNHDVSRLDRVINTSRKYFDVAHRYTVMGLIGFSGLALMVTVYATVDMMIYNRKRRDEFFTLQKQLQADSLEAARLAYMSGTASPEQISLVEDATAKAKSSGVSMPALLGTPQSAAAPAGRAGPTAERTTRPGEAMTESSVNAADEEPQKKRGFKDWLFSGLKKEDSVAAALSFSDEEAAASGREDRAGVVQAVGQQKDALTDKAKAAFDAERDNQKRGGPLDQVGLDSSEPKKSRWW